MSEREQDPAANTQKFRAFAHEGGSRRGEPKDPKPPIAGIIIAIVAVAVVVGVLVWALT